MQSFFTLQYIHNIDFYFKEKAKLKKEELITFVSNFMYWKLKTGSFPLDFFFNTLLKLQCQNKILSTLLLLFGSLNFLTLYVLSVSKPHATSPHEAQELHFIQQHIVQ